MYNIQHLCTQIHTQTHIHTYIHTPRPPMLDDSEPMRFACFLCVCVYIYIYTYTYMYNIEHLCTQIHPQTHTHTNLHTPRPPMQDDSESMRFACFQHYVYASSTGQLGFTHAYQVCICMYVCVCVCVRIR
jgi:hypothetical protein